MNDKQCDFCSDELYQKQNILKGNHIRVWYPIRPVVFGHFMLITKRHIELFTELTSVELIEIRELTDAIFKTFKRNGASDGFNILNNNLREAGQHIAHTHIHVLMRKKGEMSPFKILSNNAYREKISDKEWSARVEKLRTWMTKETNYENINYNS